MSSSRRVEWGRQKLTQSFCVCFPDGVSGDDGEAKWVLLVQFMVQATITSWECERREKWQDVDRQTILHYFTSNRELDSNQINTQKVSRNTFRILTRLQYPQSHHDNKQFTLLIFTKPKITGLSVLLPSGRLSSQNSHINSGRSPHLGAGGREMMRVSVCYE